MEQKCLCEFIEPGKPMKLNADCPFHDRPTYPCGRCSCEDYKPTKAPIKEKGMWFVCTCGHIAQDH